MKEGFIECPFCKNEIKEGALKCQFCGEFLESKNNQSKNGKSKKLLKWFCLLGTIIIVCLVAWYIIRNKPSNTAKNERVDNLNNEINKNLENLVTEEDFECSGLILEKIQTIDSFFNCTNIALSEDVIMNRNFIAEYFDCANNFSNNYRATALTSINLKCGVITQRIIDDLDKEYVNYFNCVNDKLNTDSQDYFGIFSDITEQCHFTFMEWFLNRMNS